MTNKELLLLIGRRIRETRQKKNISQMSLAYSIGISMNTLSYIENGKVATSLITLNKIVNELNISFDYIFKNTEEREEKINFIKKKLDELL